VAQCLKHCKIFIILVFREVGRNVPVHVVVPLPADIVFQTTGTMTQATTTIATAVAPVAAVASTTIASTKAASNAHVSSVNLANAALGVLVLFM
jgi:hypothetical protein